MITELSEFIQVVDGIYGFYLDTIAAYHRWRERLIETQKKGMWGQISTPVK